MLTIDAGQTIPLYLHKAGESQPRIQAAPFRCDADEYERRLRCSAVLTGSALEVARHLARNPHLRLNGVFSSVYVTPDGTVHLLRPHKHNETAAAVLLQPNIPPGCRMVPETIPKSDLHANAMARYLGVMRAQFLIDGVGLSAEMSRRPTREQAQAVTEYFGTTSRQRCTAEVLWHGELLARLLSLADLALALEDLDLADLCKEGEPQMRIRAWLSAHVPAARIVPGT